MMKSKKSERRYFLPEYDDFGREISKKKRMIKDFRFGLFIGTFAALRSLIREEEYTVEEHIYFTITYLLLAPVLGFAIFLIRPAYYRLKAWLIGIFR